MFLPFSRFILFLLNGHQQDGGQSPPAPKTPNIWPIRRKTCKFPNQRLKQNGRGTHEPVCGREPWGQLRKNHPCQYWWMDDLWMVSNSTQASVLLMISVMLTERLFVLFYMKKKQKALQGETYGSGFGFSSSMCRIYLLNDAKAQTQQLSLLQSLL